MESLRLQELSKLSPDESGNTPDGAGQCKKVADAVRICRLFTCRSDSLLCAGPSVVNVYINYEKKFAFVEFRTGALSSQCLGISINCTPKGRGSLLQYYKHGQWPHASNWDQPASKYHQNLANVFDIIRGNM
jgi:hypothetical protein